MPKLSDSLFCFIFHNSFWKVMGAFSSGSPHPHNSVKVYYGCNKCKRNYFSSIVTQS